MSPLPLFAVAVIAAFATHRIVRLILEDDIFEDQRDRFHTWLEKGQSLPARETGKALIIGAAIVGAALIGPWTDLTADDRVHVFEACVAAGLFGALLGCRNWLRELLSCQFCLGVWVSAGIVAALTEAVPTRFAVGVALVFAVASAQSFLHLAEFIMVRVVMILDVALTMLEDDDPDAPTVDDDDAATFA